MMFQMGLFDSIEEQEELPEDDLALSTLNEHGVWINPIKRFSSKYKGEEFILRLYKTSHSVKPGCYKAGYCYWGMNQGSSKPTMERDPSFQFYKDALAYEYMRMKRIMSNELQLMFYNEHLRSYCEYMVRTDHFDHPTMDRDPLIEPAIRGLVNAMPPE